MKQNVKIKIWLTPLKDFSNKNTTTLNYLRVFLEQKPKLQFRCNMNVIYQINKNTTFSYWNHFPRRKEYTTKMKRIQALI